MKTFVFVLSITIITCISFVGCGSKTATQPPAEYFSSTEYASDTSTEVPINNAVVAKDKDGNYVIIFRDENGNLIAVSTKQEKHPRFRITSGATNIVK